MSTTAINVEKGSDTPVISFGIVGCSNGKVYISTPTTDAQGYFQLLECARNELAALIKNQTLHPTNRVNRVHGLD